MRSEKFSPEKEKWIAQERGLKACWEIWERIICVLNRVAPLIDFGPTPEHADKVKLPRYQEKP